MPKSRICSVEGCGKPCDANSFCASHYARARRYGNPLSGDTPKGDVYKFMQDATSYKGDDCLLSPYYRDGHGRAVIHLNGKVHRMHRLVCEAVHGPALSPQHIACHSCGRGHMGCVAPTHLYWGTHKQNSSDTLVHGTHNRGERHGVAKLTEADVRQIRNMHGSTTRKQIAIQFGISINYVDMIVRRERWAWLD